MSTDDSKAAGATAELPPAIHALDSIVRKFYQASSDYDSLRLSHAAARTLHENDNWPETVGRTGELFVGVEPGRWREMLDLPETTKNVPCDDNWIRINDEIWHGVFFSDAEVGRYRLAHIELITEALQRFGELSHEATKIFDMQSTPSSLDFPLGKFSRDRWLEVIYGLPLTEDIEDQPFHVKKLVGDIFVMSARAIEQHLRAPPSKDREQHDSKWRTKTPRGRKSDPGEVAERQNVSEKWQYFKKQYQDLGYKKASIQNFLYWADDSGVDISTDDPKEVARMLDAHRK